jgi:hypothetical protein
VIPHADILATGKSLATESRSVCYQWLEGRAIGELLFDAYKVCVWNNKKVLEMENGCTAL